MGNNTILLNKYRSDLHVLLRSILQRIEVDRAVFFGFLNRMFGLVTGPVTALLIITKFTPELQGYYYTFSSLLALQGFAELGLGTVIVQFASHEWAHLNFNPQEGITGDQNSLSRLKSLAQLATKWYLITGLITSIGFMAGGYVFFSQDTSSMIVWQKPWFILCVLSGLNLYILSVLSLLEGCNQVSNVYIYRFWQSLLVSLFVWCSIMLGANLWTAVISNFISLLCAVIFLYRRYRIFLRTLISKKITGPRISWRYEILPFQSRIALSWLSGYFVFSFFAPVLFQYHGPVVAGQMGITLSLMNALYSFAFAWLSPKAPRFGILIAKREYTELDRLFWKLTKIISIITSLAAMTIWLMVYSFYVFGSKFAVRVLPPLPIGLFLLAAVIVSISFPMSQYMRAHKKEPILFLSIISACLIAASNLILGKYYSANGMALGFLVVNVIMIPLVAIVWNYHRKLWQRMN